MKQDLRLMTLAIAILARVPVVLTFTKLNGEKTTRSGVLSQHTQTGEYLIATDEGYRTFKPDRVIACTPAT